jgi:hypothetical protein
MSSKLPRKRLNFVRININIFLFPLDSQDVAAETCEAGQSVVRGQLAFASFEGTIRLDASTGKAGCLCR